MCCCRCCERLLTDGGVASGDGGPGGAESLLHVPAHPGVRSPGAVVPGGAAGSHHPAAGLCQEGTTKVAALWGSYVSVYMEEANKHYF